MCALVDIKLKIIILYAFSRVNDNYIKITNDINKEILKENAFLHFHFRVAFMFALNFSCMTFVPYFGAK